MKPVPVEAINRLFNIYTGLAVSHGFGRTIYYTQNAHVSEYNYKDKFVKRPILITERVQMGIINGLTNIIFSPFTFLDDVATFEMYMRGIPRYRSPFMFSLSIRYEE
jgi:hypothetical protein